MFQSTHPRRVWLGNQGTNKDKGEFQSTHPRRVWHCLSKGSAALDSFNPHTHEGCDFTSNVILRTNSLFQSTHPRRVWLKIGIVLNRIFVFQSTHPRRVWLSFAWRCLLVRGFNPHTHEGCDLAAASEPCLAIVSIHTPTKGVTIYCDYILIAFGVSIHTPTKGVTSIWMHVQWDMEFQSTHPRRVWPKEYKDIK